MPPPKEKEKEKGNNPPKNPHRPKKDLKTFEFRIYTLSATYMGEYELLVTVTHKFKSISTDSGRQLVNADACAEEYVRNIGMYGITVEDPKDSFIYYPPNRVAKIEYNELD